MNVQSESVSKAERLAAVIGGTGKSMIVSVARPVLLRIPEHDLAELDAMAKMAEKSRNAMAIHLLEVAIEAVREAMTEEDLTALNGEVIKRHSDFFEDTADRESVEA